MTFIRVARSQSGAYTVQLAEKDHGKRRILRHIGSAHTAQELKRLKAIASSLKQHPDQISLLPPERPTAPYLRVTGHAYICFEAVVRDYYEQLRFRDIGDELLFDLILMRIYEPCSKLRSLALLEHIFHRKYSSTATYRLLRSLESQEPEEPDKEGKQTAVTAVPQTSIGPPLPYSPEEKPPKPKEILLQKLHAAHMKHYGGALTVVLYDVTTLYFESARNGDEYKAPGYSKDGKHNDPQILVGLLTNMSGFPLGYETWPGNTFEGATLLTALLNWQSQFSGSRLRVIADAGMLSKLNVSQLVENGFDFIVGARMNSLDDELTAEIIAEINKPDPKSAKVGLTGTSSSSQDAMPAADSTSDDHTASKHKTTGSPDDEPIADGTIKTFVYTATVVTKYKDSDGQTTKTSQDYHYRMVVQYKQHRAKKDLHVIDKAVAKAEAIVEGKQTLKRRSPFVVIDEPSKKAKSLNQEAIDHKKALAGLKGYITNLGTQVASDKEVIGQYHELWHVEKSFRMSKHDLRARPIFHYKEDSIKAHLLIVVMALAVSRLIEKDSGQSIQHVRDQLLQAVSYFQEDRLTYVQYVQHPELNELDLTPKLSAIVRRSMRKEQQQKHTGNLNKRNTLITDSQPL